MVHFSSAWGSGFDKDSRQGLLLLTTGNNEECSTAAKKGNAHDNV